ATALSGIPMRWSPFRRSNRPNSESQPRLLRASLAGTRARPRESEQRRQDDEQCQCTERQRQMDANEASEDAHGDAAEGAQAQPRHAVKADDAAPDFGRRMKLDERLRH